MYNITFQQMEAFLTAAKYLNLSKAADAMFVSQSALSKTLQRFEEGVELQLFNPFQPRPDPHRRGQIPLFEP